MARVTVEQVEFKGMTFEVHSHRRGDREEFQFEVWRNKDGKLLFSEAVWERSSREALCAGARKFFDAPGFTEVLYEFQRTFCPYPSRAIPVPEGSGLKMSLDGVRLGATRMARRKREPVRNLRPLNEVQIEYLARMGAHMAKFVRDKQGVGAGSDAWWTWYFDIDASEVDWSSPFAMFEPKTYENWHRELVKAIAGARENHAFMTDLLEAGSWPPGQPTHIAKGADPFTAPEWLEWWQAENAFRRGFMAAWDDTTLSTLGDQVRMIVKRDGALSQRGMEQLAKTFKGDPAIHQFFTELHEAFAQGNAPEFGKVSVMLAEIKDYRDNVYIQFSPYFVPERGAGGGGFLGVGDTEVDADALQAEAVIQDAGYRHGYVLSIEGRVVGGRGSKTLEEAIAKYKRWCTEHNYFPQLYFVNERGMVDAMNPDTGRSMHTAGVRKKRARRRRPR